MLVCIYILVIDKNDFLEELQWSETLQTLADEILIECVSICMSPNVCVCVCFVLCMCMCARMCVFVCVLCESLEFMLINRIYHCPCSTMNFILLTYAVGSLYIIEYRSAHAPIARIYLLFKLLLTVDLELISLPPQSGCAQCEGGWGGGRFAVNGRYPSQPLCHGAMKRVPLFAFSCLV